MPLESAGPAESSVERLDGSRRSRCWVVGLVAAGWCRLLLRREGGHVCTFVWGKGGIKSALGMC